MFDWNLYGLQEAFSPAIEEFRVFHDYLILVLVFVISIVFFFMSTLKNPRYLNQGFLSNEILEGAWTIAPAIILVIIAIPSLRILYRLDVSFNSSLTLKVIAHQWYWRYEFSDFWRVKRRAVSFDSYIISQKDLNPGQFRLLETDNRPVLPFLTSVRVLIRRADVLHSWALPRAGVKLDATPGRLNQTSLIRNRPGIIYGQCSEICGANHRFIPIRLEFTRITDFLGWVETE